VFREGGDDVLYASNAAERRLDPQKGCLVSGGVRCEGSFKDFYPLLQPPKVPPVCVCVRERERERERESAYKYY
jgi:hypothetical protein